MLSRRIDPCPKEIFKHTIECLATVELRGQRKLLCGLNTGCVQIIDFESGRPEISLQVHKQLVTCILPTDTLVWTGSFDQTIQVFDLRQSKPVFKTLSAHRDAVTCLTDAGDNTIWSCGLNGQLLRWNKTSLRCMTKVDFVLCSPTTGRPLPLYSLKVLDGKLWIGTGNSIRIVDPKTLTIEVRLPVLVGNRARSSSQPIKPVSLQAPLDMGRRASGDVDDGSSSDGSRSLSFGRRPGSFSMAMGGRPGSSGMRRPLPKPSLSTSFGGPTFAASTPKLSDDGQRALEFLQSMPATPAASSNGQLMATSPAASRARLSRPFSPNAASAGGVTLRPRPYSPTSGGLAGPAQRPASFAGSLPSGSLPRPRSLFANSNRLGSSSSSSSLTSPTGRHAPSDSEQFATSPDSAATSPNAISPNVSPGKQAKGKHAKPKRLFPEAMDGSEQPWHGGGAASLGSPPQGKSSFLKSRARSSSGGSLSRGQRNPQPHGKQQKGKQVQFSQQVGSSRQHRQLQQQQHQQQQQQQQQMQQQQQVQQQLEESGAQFNGGSRVKVAAAHCLVEARHGEVWSCSENTGHVQVWSMSTHKLIDEWRLDCGGIISLCYLRQSIWAGAYNGSVYVWDAMTRKPLMELKCHSDAVRCLCPIDERLVVSGSGARDGIMHVWKTVARGRQCTRAVSTTSTPAFGLAENQILSFDRYGFQHVESTDQDEGAPALSESLSSEQRERFEVQQQRQLKHHIAWAKFLKGQEGSEHKEPSDSGLGEGSDAHTTETDGTSSSDSDNDDDDDDDDGDDDSQTNLTDLPCPRIGEELRQSAMFKQLVRGGIPDPLRKPIWGDLINWWIGKEREACGPGYFERLSDTKRHKVPQQIELDLLRTFPYNKFYQGQESSGVKKLRKVLLAFSRHNTTVGYCQGFNFVAGFALLFLPEEMAFWCLVALVEKIMPAGYYVHPMSVSRADQRVLSDVLETSLPLVHKAISEQQVDLNLITFHWFFTMFVDCVPTETSLRIWDNMFLEGHVVLFWYAVAIFKINEGQLLAINDRSALTMHLKTMARDAYDVSTLAEIAGNTSITPELVERHRRFRLTELENEEKFFAEQYAQRKALQKARAAAAAAGLPFEPQLSPTASPPPSDDSATSSVASPTSATASASDSATELTVEPVSDVDPLMGVSPSMLSLQRTSSSGSRSDAMAPASTVPSSGSNNSDGGSGGGEDHTCSGSGQADSEPVVDDSTPTPTPTATEPVNCGSGLAPSDPEAQTALVYQEQHFADASVSSREEIEADRLAEATFSDTLKRPAVVPSSSPSALSENLFSPTFSNEPGSSWEMVRMKGEPLYLDRNADIAEGSNPSSCQSCD